MRPTTSGSSALPPAATRAMASTNVVTSPTRSLSRYPTPSGRSPIRPSACAGSQNCDRISTPVCGRRRRNSMAATKPSSSCRGGIWTSMIATSGRCASVLRSRSSASPACATTSSPASVSSRAMPSRSRTSSSPMTTRSTAQPPSISCRNAGLGSWSLGRKPLAPARRRGGLRRGVGVGRDEDDARRPRHRPQPSRQRQAVAVGQPDIHERHIRAQLTRARDRLLDGAGLADHRVAPRGQHPGRLVTERGVIVDDEHRARHRAILAPPGHAGGRAGPTIFPASGRSVAGRGPRR